MAYFPTITNPSTSDLQTSQLTALNSIATNTGSAATDFTSTGTISAANGVVSITGQGVYSISANLSGTWSGTVVFEGQLADSTWVPVFATAMPLGVTSTPIPSVTANGAYLVTGGGYLNVRARASAYSSGTISVALDGSLSQQCTYVQQAGPIIITPPALTKGTQTASGFATQDLKDSGRVKRTFFANFTAATTEALISLTPVADGVAGTAATSFGVTAGKRFRILDITVSTRNAAAAVQSVTVFLRTISTGAVTTSSPIVASVAASTTVATANISNSNDARIFDGYEISGNEQFGVSQVGTATANNVVTVNGYEY